MQIVSGFLGKISKYHQLSAEFTHRVVKVKAFVYLGYLTHKVPFKTLADQLYFFFHIFFVYFPEKISFFFSADESQYFKLYFFIKKKNI